MVFTHVLILDKQVASLIDNLDPIFASFAAEVPKEQKRLVPLSLSITLGPVAINSVQPQYITQTLTGLLKGTLPVLFSGTTAAFQKTVQMIWNLPLEGFRKNIRFRASFTPSDIDGITNLTLVIIQKEFLPKWAGKEIIYGENSSNIEVISDLESFFINNDPTNPFSVFLTELGLSKSDFQSIRQASEIFSEYKKLDSITDGNKVRQAIRVIARVSPSPKDGQSVKEIFFARLQTLITSGADTNLKALRNINWQAFDNGENRIKALMTRAIDSEAGTEKLSIAELTEILHLSIVEEEKNWWHAHLSEIFRDQFAKSIQPYLPEIWRLIDYSKESLTEVFLLLKPAAENETALRGSMPAKLKSALTADLEHAAATKKWYLLHADLLLKYLKREEALLRQYDIEKTLPTNSTPGVDYLAGQLSNSDLLELTLSHCNEKAIRLIAERIKKDGTILKNIDVKNPCWLNIWGASLQDSQNISYGVIGQESTIIHATLDLVVKGRQIPDSIFERIAESDFANMSDYSSRASIWSRIPSKYLDKFKSKTTKAVFALFIAGGITVQEIEAELIKEIVSDSFLTMFLSENRNNIIDVIKVYESFGGLRDKFLADYIKFYQGTISEPASGKLGELINKSKFRESATSIYYKSNQDRSFKLALEYCKNLVNLSWWDTLFGGTPKPSPQSFKQNEHMKSSKLPIVVILTAIKEEFAAVIAHLSDIKEIDKDGTGYEGGMFVIDEKEKAIIIVRECGARNTTASQETERAIQYFKPDMILFVGIAGSRKPNDFKIGDVIFPEKVYSYEGGKATETSFKSRPDAVSPTFTLTEQAKKIRRKDDWKSLILGEFPDTVQADIGIIASGEQLIEHHDSEIGKILTEHYNDASVVEMEGYGFLKTALRQGDSANSLQAGVIRGVSDIIQSPEQKTNSNQDRRPADAKLLASRTAAAFTFWLINKSF